MKGARADWHFHRTASAGGAIIAAELATVVIGGLVSSTLLTLIVLPVVFSPVDGLVHWVGGLMGMGGPSAEASAAD